MAAGKVAESRPTDHGSRTVKTIHLRNGAMAASISSLGAELRSLTIDGRNLIWSPEPAIWEGTSQILFPVIGRVVDDEIRVDGQTFAMPQHGFALSSTFSLERNEDDLCLLRLRAGPETRRRYPYDFTLNLEYALSATALTVRVEIVNEGDRVLPASFGLHPGFCWPLLADVPKNRHLITFAEDGPIACTRPVHGLFGTQREKLPLEGRSLRLEPSLLEKSGLIILPLKERSLLYHTDDGQAGIRLDFPGMDRVTLWSRLDGDFVCIEPVLGHADPAGFCGDLTEKPGMAHIAPGDGLGLSVTITPEFASTRTAS